MRTVGRSFRDYPSLIHQKPTHFMTPNIDTSFFHQSKSKFHDQFENFELSDWKSIFNWFFFEPNFYTFVLFECQSNNQSVQFWSGTNFPIENFWMRRKHFHIFTFYFKNNGNWIENYGKTFAYLRRILCKHFPVWWKIVFPSLVNIDISTESVHNQRCDFDWLNS